MNPISVIGYEDVSGRILAVATFDAGSFRDVDRNVYEREGFSTLVVEDAVEVSRKDIYIKNGTLSERPTFAPSISPSSIAADGASIVKISKFPKNSTLKISGPIEDTWDEPGTTSSITVNLPGTYRVAIQNWPYQDTEVTFDAT